MQIKTRKDANVEKTISDLDSIIASLALNISVAETIESSALWSSTRIEIEGLNGLGTNGKGINIKYALASAYAELIERLSSNYLLYNLYPRKNCISRLYQSQNVGIDLLYACDIINRIDGYMIPEEAVEELIKEGKYCRVQDYYDVFQGKVIQLPQWFIDANCGSNGLCAGNSPEEAILQGINEIQERYSRSLFFNGLIETHNIPDQDLINLSSWKMVEEIRKLGYVCVVKDFTAHGTLPVLGVLIADPSLDHYLVTLGADYSIDICLQRCITEMFQGREANMWLRFHFNTTFLESGLFAKMSSDKAKLFYQSNIANNRGNYPLKIFDFTTCDGSYKNAFLNETATNKEALQYALTILNNAGFGVYIHDYNRFGFPAYRVFIPGISEISHLAQDILMNTTYLNEVSHLLFNPELADTESVAKFTTSIEKLDSLPFYKIENLFFAITRIPVLDDSFHIGFDDIYVVTSIFNFYIGNYETAYDFYCKYTEGRKSNRIDLNKYERGVLLTLRCFCDGLNWDDIIPLLHTFNCYEIFELLKDPQYLFGYLPKCPNCALCKIKKCIYLKVKQLQDQLLDYKEPEQSRLANFINSVWR